MVKRRVGYLMLVLVVIGISMGILIGREKPIELQAESWLGKERLAVEEDIDTYIQKNQLKLMTNTNGYVTDILIRSPHLAINNIRVGDDAHKILKIYPEEWINSFPGYILVLKGKENLFGVAGEYVIYLIKDAKIEEIQLGYTTTFVMNELPDSNESALNNLQGTWISEHNKVLTFNGGFIEDNLLDDLYEHQAYTIVAPNKMLITRLKEEKIEKVALRFYINKDKLYLFDINQLGIPIASTIETFVMK